MFRVAKHLTPVFFKGPLYVDGSVAKTPAYFSETTRG